MTIKNYFAALAVVLAAAVNTGCPSKQHPLEDKVSSSSKVSEEDTKNAVFNKLSGYTINRVTNTPDTAELMPVTVGDSAAFYNPVNRGVYLIPKGSKKPEIVFGSSIEKPDNPFITQLIGGKDYLVFGAVHNENNKEIYRIHMINLRTKKDKVIFEADNRKYVIRDFSSSDENEIVLEQIRGDGILKLYGADTNGNKRELGKGALDYWKTRNRTKQQMYNQLAKDTRRVTGLYGNEQRGIVAVDGDLYSYTRNACSSQPAKPANKY